MPLRRDQFDKGLDNTAYEILQFLKQHSDSAFSVNEIIDGVNMFNIGPNESMLNTFLAAWAGITVYSNALKALVAKGEIIEKTLSGTQWYSAKK